METTNVNNILLKNQSTNEEIREIRKYLETTGNKNATSQNLWNAVKTVPQGTFIVI